MSTAPFGPHGPQVPANTTTPNPTAQSAPILSGDNDQGAASSYAYSAPVGGAGGGLGILIIDFTFTLFTLLYFWPFFACLYPLTVASSLGIAWTVRPLIAGAFPPARPMRSWEYWQSL